MTPSIDYQQLRETLSSRNEKGLDASFQLVQACSTLLASDATEHQGRDLVIRALKNLDYLNQATHVIWNDLVEAAGLHPYVEKSKLWGSGAVRHEYHRSRHLPRFYLHREQLALSVLLDEGKSLIVSAPTSFGKSLLIEEIVASKQHQNIVIIQPTLALLDETRKKIK